MSPPPPSGGLFHAPASGLSGLLLPLRTRKEKETDSDIFFLTRRSSGLYPDNPDALGHGGRLATHAGAAEAVGGPVYGPTLEDGRDLIYIKKRVTFRSFDVTL
jgi:hypothetical protein